MPTDWEDHFYPAPQPATTLGRHRQLSPTAGIHVSPICLGAMSIGDKWKGMGCMDKESSFSLLDAFYEAGGNFIDTANAYHNGTSEMFIGEWSESRDVRDQMVIATKYTMNFKMGQRDVKQKTSFVGNNMKSMHLSVEQSLKNLRTSYIDIFYLHWWDYRTSIEEVMNGLHSLVMAGKVLYLGISDTPAWIVSSANRYARMSGKTPFVIYQGPWNVFERDFERDIIPMARMEGMALAPFNVLAAGKIRTDAEELERRQTGEKGRMMVSEEWERSEDERKVAKILEEVAAEVGAPNIQTVAIAYVMQKTPYVFPVIGGRKVEHLKSNIKALDIALADEHIEKIESAVPFFKGNLYASFGDDSAYSGLHITAGSFERWPDQPAIRPSQ